MRATGGEELVRLDYAAGKGVQAVVRSVGRGGNDGGEEPLLGMVSRVVGVPELKLRRRSCILRWSCR